MVEISQLVAHRGDPTVRPENTLPAIEAAIRAGARYVEFDVQMSADGVPIVLHDDSLMRTSGRRGVAMDMSASDLRLVRADFAGPSCPQAHIPWLADVRDLMQASPQVTAFVELKAESLRRFGTDVLVDRAVDVMRSAQFPWVIISFERDAVEYARRRHGVPIGWVLYRHDPPSVAHARALAPEYLFCNATKLPPGPVMAGAWSWVIYDINDWPAIESLGARGVQYVETSRISGLAAERKKQQA